jgi:diacylglycerol kinase (ATP)
MKALFLINERSGLRRRYDVREVIRTHWPHQREHCNVEACGAKDELDRIIDNAARDGVEVVFAVGGDGTVHEIARRLIGKPLTLGIVPTGSGNGFARHLGLPMKPAAAIRSIGGMQKQIVDTAEVNGHPFIGVMGVGFDAWIADRFASSSVRGMRTYIFHGLGGAIRYRPQKYELVIDGVEHSVTALVVAVANASQYGNDARIAPEASIQDELLNVVIVRDPPLFALPFMIRRLFNSSIHRSPYITTLRGRDIVIRRSTGGPAHVDGEPIELGEELRVRVVPRSLNVLAPPLSSNRVP